MRIYLDCCCLQRPLDDQTQPRIRVETEAVLAILAAVQVGDLSLLNSEALEYEISRTPNEARRTEVSAVLALADERVEITDEVQVLAETLERLGVQPMDAVHLALAGVGTADFFATCDDDILSRREKLPTRTCKIVSLLELVFEVTK